MHWEQLYNQLSAIEAIAVGRQGNPLSARAEQILRYLRSRLRRSR